MMEGLRTSLGDARFSRYRKHYAGNDVYALRLYHWNTTVSAAMWGPICVLEVALRNAIHTQMIEARGRDDWWNDKFLCLCQDERRSITSARERLASLRIENPTADQVVATMSFGFWTGLLGAGRPRDPGYSYETALWQPRLHRAFPNKGNLGRKYIYAELEKVRALRNRIAHHEPIFAAPLQTLFHQTATLAGLISTGLEDYIRAHSRALEVIDSKEQAVKSGEVKF